MVEVVTVTKDAIEEFITPSYHYLVIPKFEDDVMKLAVKSFCLTGKEEDREYLPPQIFSGESWKTQWRKPLKDILETELGLGTTPENLFHLQAILNPGQVLHIVLVQNFRVDTLKSIRAGLRWLTREEIQNQLKTNLGQTLVAQILYQMQFQVQVQVKH